jgi:hypothetical protein
MKYGYLIEKVRKFLIFSLKNTSLLNSMEIICNTGDATGADALWTKHLQGKCKVIQWTPQNLSKDDKLEGIEKINLANKVLKRPIYKYINFLSKNWPQAKYSKVVYASGSLTKSGEKGYKGFISKCDFTHVEGGTAYAVQMAIDMGIPVYFYNQDTDYWTTFNNNTKEWNEITELEVPLITTDFGAIGSTILTEKTKQAILDLISRSFPK